MKRGKFSLSNYKLLSAPQGQLIPVNLTEVLPGDTVQQSTTAMIRVAPLLAPVMHPVHIRLHHWFVPHRLVWDDFQDFITGGPDGMDASVYPTKTFASGVAEGSLHDYLGAPITAGSLEVSALPARAYNLIYNEFYRDQDLVTEKTIDTTSGPDTTTDTDINPIGWEKDYFTSSRPWEQKGPQITVPLGDTAPVVNDGTVPNFTGTSAEFTNAQLQSTAASNVGLKVNDAYSGAAVNTRFGSNTGLEADLSSASAITVNLLREALALQRYQEARARFGSRYTEYLRYLNVKSSDARLQRPEYLGGGKQTIQFSEVLQTAEGTAPVGELRGHGIGAMRSNRYRRFFEEHGYILSLMSVRPKTIYTQGLPRHWNRRAKEDFWQKELQHIGQQEVLNKELYVDHASPDGVFGYQDRYDEYRRQESTVAGEFRGTTLDHWHMARVFASDPALNATFVNCNPTDRIYASAATDPLYCMVNNSIQARRLLAQTGTSRTF